MKALIMLRLLLFFFFIFFIYENSVYLAVVSHACGTSSEYNYKFYRFSL